VDAPNEANEFDVVEVALEDRAGELDGDEFNARRKEEELELFITQMDPDLVSLLSVGHPIQNYNQNRNSMHLGKG
jgi:hypothetical protein